MSNPSIIGDFPEIRPARTKIVATLGPASDNEEMIEKLIRAGVDLFRINMAHSRPDDAQPTLDRVRAVSTRMGQHVAVLADLAGPKMRLGTIPGGEYLCQTESTITFVRGTECDQPGCFTTTYAQLIDDLKIGDRVLLADGTVTLEVIQTTNDQAQCRVVQGGRIRSRQGVNLPGVSLSVHTLQEADKINARWAACAGIDYVGLSFVRSPEDIEELRTLLQEAAASTGLADPIIPHIIAKIEKPEALACLDELIQTADGIMVARGDLGVETDISRIALVQKEIIQTCRRYMKPVIVATQMLESMTEELFPTRAEATDVANAILDGADACMLSGETAVGKYPVEAVEMMQRIALDTEESLGRWGGDSYVMETLLEEIMESDQIEESRKVKASICDAAGELADLIGAPMVFMATENGVRPLFISKLRIRAMTVCLCTSIPILRRTSLYWGVIPLYAGIESLPKVIQLAKDEEILQAGERVVILTGTESIERDEESLTVRRV